MKNLLYLYSMILLMTFILFQISFCLAGEFVVTNTRDSGPGSWRDAINRANIHPDPDFIIFNIPQSDSAYNVSRQIMDDETICRFRNCS